MNGVIQIRWAACLVILLTVMTGALAQAQTSYVRKVITPNQMNEACIEERGMIQLVVDGKSYEKRYVLRYPEMAGQWNRKLLIGAHGGSGGNLYAREGWIMDTSETALDDVIGMYVFDRSYAYASMDRDGIGGTRVGLALTYAFTQWVQEYLQAHYNGSVDQTYLVGFSAGGAIARYAAEDTAPRYDGVLLIAGGGGGTTPQLERQAKLAMLWPEVDPDKHPDRPLTHDKVKAYAKAIGTPPDARRFWPMVGARQSLNGLRRTLERFGLTGLTDKQLANFRMKSHRKNTTFIENVVKAQATNTTGKIMVPTIEVIGTHDDISIAGVLEYKDKVKKASKKADRPTPADQHRLYQVTGVWHVSAGDNAVDTFQYFLRQMGLSDEAQDQLESSDTYIPTVQEAFDYLDKWVTDNQSPPSDQIVNPREALKK